VKTILSLKVIFHRRIHQVQTVWRYVFILLGFGIYIIIIAVVVAAIGAVVGDFGLVDLDIVLGYGLVDLHLLFNRLDQTLFFFFI
jgi:hypothetical protein